MMPAGHEERTLSERENEVLAYITICRRGPAPFSPTYPEIARRCRKEDGKPVSPQFAARIVQSLIDKGLLRRDPEHRSRLTLEEEHFTT